MADLVTDKKKINKLKTKEVKKAYKHIYLESVHVGANSKIPTDSFVLKDQL